MDKKRLTQWCQVATSRIRYGPDRQMVFDELMAHLEDHRDTLIARGLSREDAENKALLEMGSADQIAEDLARVHTPWLGYLLRTLRIVTVPLLLIAVYAAVVSVGGFFSMLIGSDNFDSIPANYAPLESYWHIDVSDTSDGYLFRVTEAGLSQDKNELYFDFQVLYWPWMDHASITDKLWAIDSNGNYYSSRLDNGHSDSPRVTAGGGSYSSCIGITSMKIIEFDKTAQWVELHYDQDGRDIVLRIDLTGGETP